MPEDVTTGAAQNTTETAKAQQVEQPAPEPAKTAEAIDPVAAVVEKEQQKAEAAAIDPAADGILAGPREKGEGAEKKDGDAAKKEEKAADPYQPFTLPEGFVEDPDAMGRLKEIAGKHKLTQEQAQEFVTAYTGLEQKRNADLTAALARQNAEWSKEIRTHPEFGGDRYGETCEQAGAMIRRFGSPRLLAEIRQMNLQNYPELTYLLARIGKSVGEDVSPGGAKGSADGGREALDSMFPGVGSGK